MTLSSVFNSGYSAKKENDYVLRVGYGNLAYFYDFMARTVTAVCSNFYNYGSVSVTPFAQMDRESLAEFREEFIRQGGKPPELPPEKPAVQMPAGKLSL